jgi:phage terminase Nu1 subunit (DNA packaging protein)
LHTKITRELQSSIPESCKLKFPIIATQHVNSYLTPTAAEATIIL